jgi:hypothetical protein
MAAHAVGLFVTGHAALQILPGGEGVAEEPKALIVMESGEEGVTLIEAKVQVAFPAECFGVVA